MSDPIRIPVHVSDGNFRWHCFAEITPEIQAQILAPLEKRIAALEEQMPHAKLDASLARVMDGLPKHQTKPAEQGADYRSEKP